MKTLSFTELNLTPSLQRGLDRMGFNETTPVQEKAIGPMMERQDLLVQAPTGTGKTCAFGIPAIEAVDMQNRNIQTVILCPTRELAIQTAGVLHKLTAYKQGIRIVALYGGERIERQITALRRRPQIIVATPGRMMDHMRRKTVRLEQVGLVVLDEADRMLDMGFREDMATILDSTPDKRQTVLFSATLSAEIKHIASKYQTDAKLIQIKQDTLTVDCVEQFYTEIRGKLKTTALMKLLRDQKFAQALVFVGTKRMADSLSQELGKSGFRAAALHGDLRQRQRDTVMDGYRKGRVDILVATDVAARGIDVDHIDAVINYDIPTDTDSYVHRIGRTGRKGNAGVAYTFIYPKERQTLRQIMVATGASILPVAIDGIAEMPVKVDSGRENRPRRSAWSEQAGQKRRRSGKPYRPMEKNLRIGA